MGHGEIIKRAEMIALFIIRRLHSDIIHCWVPGLGVIMDSTLSGTKYKNRVELLASFEELISSMALWSKAEMVQIIVSEREQSVFIVYSGPLEKRYIDLETSFSEINGVRFSLRIID